MKCYLTKTSGKVFRVSQCQSQEDGKINSYKDNWIDSSQYLYIGGIAGRLEYSDSSSSVGLESCTARGDLDIKNNYNNINNYYVGGIVAWVRGESSDDRINFNNCLYEQGSILNKPENPSSVCIGGIAAYALAARFTNCFSNADSIEADITQGNLYLGGFIGRPINLVSIQDSGNSSPIIMSDSSEPTGYVYVGGFIASFVVNSGNSHEIIQNCWSTGDIYSRGAGNLYTGGLIGYISEPQTTSSFTLKHCWTNANVTAISTGTGNAVNGFCTGGLLGFISTQNWQILESFALGDVSAYRSLGATNSIQIMAGGLVGYVSADTASDGIQNCYALGNVLADNPNNIGGNIYAGGLVGNGTYGGDANIRFNFAAGSVTAQTKGTGLVYAGGIIGYRGPSLVISNNAALGESIIAKGSSTLNAGRVYRGSAMTGSINYAYKDMLLLTDTYDGTATGSTTTSTNATSTNGHDVTIVELTTPAFWLNPSGLNFNNTLGGIGGITNTWSFTGIEGRGYPRLAWE